MPTFIADLSNDSYSTVNMGLEDGASPHSGRGSYLHGSASPPPYLSSHSPTPMGGSGTNNAGTGGGGGGSGGHQYASYADNIVYTSLGGAGGGGGSAGASGLLSGLRNGSGADDMSNDSSPVHGYPDFPPSPDSWLGDTTSAAPSGAGAASASGGGSASASAAAAVAVAASAGGGSAAGHY